MKRWEDLYAPEDRPKPPSPFRKTWADLYNDTPEQKPEPKEDEGVLGTILDFLPDMPQVSAVKTAQALNKRLFGDEDATPDLSPATYFLGGLAAETAGNILGSDTMADLRPQWKGGFKNASEGLHSVADALLAEGSKRVNVGDYGTIGGALKNSFNSGVYGSTGGLASMLHSDKAAEALMNAAAALENRNRVSTDDGYWNYFTDTRGFLSDLGQLGGSMATIAPTMMFLPEAAVARGIYALGGGALERYLIGNGLTGAAKYLAQTAPNLARYALTSAPIESAMEGGQARYDALREGLGEEEADRRAWEVAKRNLPLLGGSNFIEGALAFSPITSKLKPLLGRLSTPAQIGGRGLLGSWQQQAEEALQQGAQDEVAGKDFGVFPWDWTPAQQEAAERVTWPGALMGGGGAAFHAAFGQDDDEISDKEYTDNALRAGENQRVRENVATKELRSWAQKHTGGAMDDKTFDALAKAAQQTGVPLDRLVATALQESSGSHFRGDGVTTSPVGALGLMQLMPETAQALGVDPYDLEQNALGGAMYLKQQYNRFGDWNLAHAAYNAGPNAVEKYGGVPHYAETEDYVAKTKGYVDEINGMLGDHSFVQTDEQAQTDEQPQSNGYYGEGGKGEGNTWQKQHGDVSLDGVQPGLLDAIDMLAKWFYDKTGKKLVVTAGTNGQHADGEHSHKKGWKVDVNDWDGTSDGYLVTADGSKGTLTDEFIAYGQSLGLGMNWEGDHIDVALDGHQWADANGNPLDTPQNFGGFNPRNVSATPKSRETQETPSQPPTQETHQTPPIQPPESPKPLFDINVEDEQTQEIIGRFAEEKRFFSDDVSDIEFFEPMNSSTRKKIATLFDRFTIPNSPSGETKYLHGNKPKTKLNRCNRRPIRNRPRRRNR